MKKIIAMIILLGVQSAFGMKASKREELNYYLIEAVKKKDLGQVQSLLQQRANVNAEDKQNNTVLTWAILRNSAPIIAELLPRGAYESQGNTASMLEAQNRWRRAFVPNCWWGKY